MESYPGCGGSPAASWQASLIPAMSQPLPLITEPTSPVTVSAKPSLTAQSQPPVRPLPQAPLAQVTKTLTQKGKLLTRKPPCQQQTWNCSAGEAGPCYVPARGTGLWGPPLLNCQQSLCIGLHPTGMRWPRASEGFPFRQWLPWCPCRMNALGASPCIHKQPSWKIIASWPCQAPCPRAKDRFPGPIEPSMVLWGTCSLDIHQTTLTWCGCCRPAAASGLPPAVPSWHRSMRRRYLCSPISGTRSWRSPSMIHANLPSESPPTALSWGLVEWKGDRMVAFHDHLLGPDPPCSRHQLPSHDAWLSGEVTAWWSCALRFSWLDPLCCRHQLPSCEAWLSGEVTAWWLSILSISEYALLFECIFVLCKTGIVPDSALLKLQHSCSNLCWGSNKVECWWISLVSPKISINLVSDIGCVKLIFVKATAQAFHCVLWR